MRVAHPAPAGAVKTCHSCHPSIWFKRLMHLAQETNAVARLHFHAFLPLFPRYCPAPLFSVVIQPHG